MYSKSDKKKDALNNLGHVLMKRRLVAILAMGLTLLATVLFTEKQPRVYRSVASLIIDKSTPAVLNMGKEVIELGASSYWANKEYMKTQIELLKSRALAKRVVDRLTLALDANFLGVEKRLKGLSHAERLKELSGLDPIQVLHDSIEVTLKRESSIIFVSIDHQDPALTTELVNVLVEEYCSQNIEMRRKVLLRANDKLETMLATTKTNKIDAENKLLAFEKTNGIGSLETRKSAVEEKLTKLQTQLMEVRIGQINSESARIREELEKKITELGEQKNLRDYGKVTLSSVVASGEVASLRDELVNRQIQAKQLAIDYGKEHPKIRAVKDQIRVARKALRQSIARIINSEHKELEMELEKQNNILDAQNDTRTKLLEDLRTAREEESILIGIEQEHKPLKEEVEEITETYEKLRQRYSETTLSAQIETNNVRIQDRAVQPKKPIKPNEKFNLFAGILFGIILAIGSAYFAESLDNTIRDRSDVEDVPGLYFLGVLPSVGRVLQTTGTAGYSRERDLYPFYHPQSSVTEHLRSIQTNLLYREPDRKPRVILVVSPNPREGKTTMALHMSTVLATSGLKSILIDTDMRRPRLHKTFGTTPKNGGVAAFLVQGGQIDDYINDTEVPNLDFLGCGMRPPNPVELLQSRAFPALVDTLKQRYDMMIFDSPPMLAVADSRILSTFCDAVVYVAKARQTTRDTLWEGRSYLDGVFPYDVGCVVNDVDMSSGSYHYYYYYGTKYGYYATNASEDRPDLAQKLFGRGKNRKREE